MMEDTSNNNIVYLFLIVHITLQLHLRFAKTIEFRTLHHRIEDALIMLAISVEQMFDDFSQLMNDTIREATLEKLMKIMTEH